jgi:ribosomal protein S17
MKRIEKKTWPEFFQKILDGEKNFEVRLADFECNPGDVLALREWDPKTEQYTGRAIEKTVTFVINTKDLKFWPKEEIEKFGLYVISLK